MYFELEALNAHEGDCLLLHYGDGQDPNLVIVDGGPAGVYANVLLPRLEALRKTRRGGGRLPVRALVVSHIDDDHINGVQALLDEEVDRKDNHQPLRMQIETLWHNTFDDIVGNHATPATLTKTAATTAEAGEPGLALSDPGRAAAVLASVGQGRNVRDAAKKLSIELNFECGGRLITRPHAPIDMRDGLTFTVIGPSKARINALQREWDNQLKKSNLTRTVVAEIADRAVANLSSIVVLAERGGKSILLTGDARGDDVVDGLKEAGRLAGDGTFRCDVLKVPHHGSGRNVDQNFFATILAKHYVISADGRHGNPDRKMLDDLLAARADDRFTLWFTNAVEHAVERIKEARDDGRRFGTVFREVDAPGMTVKP